MNDLLALLLVTATLSTTKARHAEQPADQHVGGVEGERRPDSLPVLVAAEDFLEDGALR